MCSENLSFFFDFYVESSSRYRLVHILPASSSKPASDAPVSFLRVLCEIELALQSRAHFVDLMVQKWSDPDSLLTFSSANRALPTVLCTFCRQLLQIEARNRGNRDPGSHFTRTKHWVSCPRIFSNLNSCVPDLLHFPTT